MLAQIFAALLIFRVWKISPGFAKLRSFHEARADVNKLSKMLSCRFCFAFWCGLVTASLNVLFSMLGEHARDVWETVITLMAVIALTEITSELLER